MGGAVARVDRRQERAGHPRPRREAAEQVPGQDLGAAGMKGRVVVGDAEDVHGRTLTATGGRGKRRGAPAFTFSFVIPESPRKRTAPGAPASSEEHTSELQSLMRIS